MSYVEGSIQRYLFYNEDNSYSVIKIKIHDTDETELIYFEPTIIVCGFFPKLETSTKYKFYGEVKDHPKYGIQYNSTRFERFIDNTKSGLVEYLSSDLFKGIGKKTAEKIVDKLGLTALDLIADDPSVLNGIPRINHELKNSIYLQIIDNRDLENSLVWLYGFDISPRMAMKIYQVYKNATVQTIKENPYVLIDTVEGIGFRRADEIGLKVGFQPNSPLRISAVIYFLLNEYMNKFGDTYLEKEKLIDFTKKYLRTDDFDMEDSLINEQLDFLIQSNRLTLLNDTVSLTYLYQAEAYIAKRVMHFNNEKETSSFNIFEFISKFEEFNHITYTKAQKEAINVALTNNFSIITGGPGTGKTTVIKGVVDIYQMLHNYREKDIALAAPTGKAAKRLSEATNIPAKTIHKLLGYDFQGNYTFDETNPIEAKIIIIDEASMMDCLLAKRLLNAISSDAQIIFVGDANQLPSVGPGDILNNLITSNLFNVIKLDIIHRQAKDSNIISLAYDILNKNIEQSIFDIYEDRKFIRCMEGNVANNILAEIKKLIDLGYDLYEEIQVLIPLYKGFVGIDRMNHLIQSTFNYENRHLCLVYKEKTFYYKDKVMQLVNQPEDNIMNGDIGFVESITEDDELVINFSGNKVTYSLKDLDNLTLAYAISIHKSQGSEFKAVLLPFVRSYTMMLKRKLLYTAVTRAKEKLILVGDFETYKRGVLGKDTQRNTLLNYFLEQVINPKDDGSMRIEDFL